MLKIKSSRAREKYGEKTSKMQQHVSDRNCRVEIQRYKGLKVKVHKFFLGILISRSK